MFLQVESIGVPLYARVISAFCVSIILLAVFINFQAAKEKRTVEKEKRSIVATGSMLLFFLFFLFLISIKVFVINFKEPVASIIVIVGIILLVFGCLVNVLGRLNLQKNWANQVIVYNDHQLVKYGIYGIFRHPLYASLIWMFYGASLIYSNYVAFLANTLIFLPFMYYRAKQEEYFLSQKFPEYNEYKRKTGMFLPKFIK